MSPRQGTQPGNNPRDSAPTKPPISSSLPSPVKTPISVKGKGIVYLEDPIIEGGQFSWAEATMNGERLPVDEKVTERIITIAHSMEEVRTLFGNKPVIVHSWYSSPAVNQAVRGDPDSRHLYGDAVDFHIDGMSIAEVHAKLSSWWGDKGGIAYSDGGCFVHIDKRGKKARWTYPF